MAFKILCGLIAASLMIVFVAPVALKLKEMSLYVVAGIGIVLMLFDLWQSLQSKDD